jgi:tRNA uridine 5-carboxymethylaminomethyl modification enzyme
MPDVTLSKVAEIINKTTQVNHQSNATSSNSTDMLISPLVYDTVEATCKYAHYLNRQEMEMVRWKQSGSLVLPLDLVYSLDTFPALSGEELEKLRKHRPSTLHEAGKIAGVTPHALVYIHNSITRGHYKKRLKMLENQSGMSNQSESASME